MSGIPAWAVRGAKVVCVSDAEWLRSCEPGQESAPHPLKGETATIEKVIHLAGEEPYVWLYEYAVCEFKLRFFRPLVDDEAQERDAAMFRRIARMPNPALQGETPPNPYKPVDA